jgi:hypothetical protein
MLLAPAAAWCEDGPAPLHGAVCRGLAWAGAVRPNGDKNKLSILSLCYAPLVGGATRTIDECSWGLGPALNWVAGHDHVWVGKDNALALTPQERRDYLHRYRLDDLLKGRRVTYAGEKDGIPESYFLPDGGALGDNHSLTVAAEFTTKTYVSYLPTGPEQVRLFLLTNVRGRLKSVDDKGNRTLEASDEERAKPLWSMTAYDFKGEWDAKKKEWGEGKWGKGEPIAVDFEEPFQVVARGDDYYFVTASGEVHRSPKPDEGKERKAEVAWDDDKRPVVAFIQDLDSGKNFVFCKPDKGGKGVYFELAPKPEPCPYDGKDIMPARPHDPLPAVLGYAKVLLADKKVKEK